MEFFIVNETRLMAGAHATTMLVNDHVAARLGSYGPAVTEVEVRLLYPPKAARATSPNTTGADFTRRVKRAPRVTYNRAKRAVAILYVCRGVSPPRLLADDHFTLAETEAVVSAASAALELLRGRFTTADHQFDGDAFVTDAQTALAGCPKAVRRYLSKG